MPAATSYFLLIEPVTTILRPSPHPVAEDVGLFRMHGLIFRTLQVFIQDTYGPQAWLDVVNASTLDVPEFEAMLTYDTALRPRVVAGAEKALGKPAETILEDVGTYLVSHPNSEGLRRLLRFGGVDFIEFLHSLDDLPGRARLAVSDLDLPDLELRDLGGGRFCLQVNGEPQGFGHVLVGVLRAMADDYGTLVLLDHSGQRTGCDYIDITVVETEYSEGREFALAAGPMARAP